MAEEQKTLELAAKMPEKAIDFSKVPMPHGNWVKFGGTIPMKAVWEIQEAKEEQSSRVLAKHLHHIIDGWSYEWDHKDPDSIGELGPAEFRKISEAAGEYIGSLVDTGN